MVDPDRNVAQVCRRDDDGALKTVGELSAAEAAILTTPLIPGLALSMTELFAE